MPSSTPITQELLISILDYDPETGIFVWKKRPDAPQWSSRWAGKRAGVVNAIGYRAIGILCKPMLEHRLAFIWMTGEAPKIVDHINLDRADNRWANLRPATKSQNQVNCLPRRDNKSGYKGVSFNRMLGKWSAELHVNGEKKYLGVFLEKEDAAAAYAKAAEEHFGEFARY